LNITSTLNNENQFKLNCCNCLTEDDHVKKSENHNLEKVIQKVNELVLNDENLFKDRRLEE
jgi:hypothetical protein